LSLGCFEADGRPEDVGQQWRGAGFGGVASATYAAYVTGLLDGAVIESSSPAGKTVTHALAGRAMETFGQVGRRFF